MDEWSCMICTFINPSDAGTCGMCESPKPQGDIDTWVCQFCTFENLPNSIRCDVCGQYDESKLAEQAEREKNKSAIERDRDMRVKIRSLREEVSSSMRSSIRLIERNAQNMKKKVFDWEKDIYFSKKRFQKESQFKRIHKASIEDVKILSQSEVLKLKIGKDSPKTYMVSRSTLLKFPGMLSAMFSGRYNNIPDKTGYFVIPYEGQMFDYVLDFMRNGGKLENASSLISQPEDLCNLLQAAEYFALEPMIQELARVLDMQPDYNVNILSHEVTGGKLRLVDCQGYGGASNYGYELNNSSPNESYVNNGLFIDQTPSSHYTVSYKQNTSNGILWNNDGRGTGVLVVDITGKDNGVKIIRRLMMFQMTDSYFCTHLKFYYHNEKSNPPSYEDEHWIPINEDWLRVQLRGVTGNPPGQTGGNTIRDSLDHIIEPVITRFLKIEAKNDNSNGHSSYIGIRQIKAFSSLEGEKRIITSKQARELFLQ
eukprot:TRINITY_DN12764_c0_g1_i1.p1 TRINITY_DN12764_c0_g1~~TRINITY_DN12764_c0_g1_i1.p1  ORF type:complete len:482 (+),score=87.07 TRINITY_DN12764_c0_g1_i1:3-1448(+)